MNLALVIICSYFLGSIPFGLVLTKLAGLGDIRQIGSGNIGATNVLRTGNKWLAALTLFLDGAKAAVAILLTRLIAPELEPIAALAALIGHVFPVWLKFKGGKGVATAAGIYTALCWPLGVGYMVTWIIVVKVSRYSSVGALVAVGLAPVYALLFGRADILWLTVVILVLVFSKHATNIKRLKNGTEPKIGKKRDAMPSA